MPAISAVVPTLGRSPLLARCLQCLRTDGGSDLEIVVVAQGECRPSEALEIADRVERLPSNVGFTGGCNRGISVSAGELVGVVNDDALVQPGWFRHLTVALEASPRAAAAQGANLKLDQPRIVDGCGIAFNRFWRPVQIGDGAPLPDLEAAALPVFGVSGTAALFRRQALEAVARAGGEVFDTRLGSYYEDVDLALRLRHRGYEALFVPSARALHAGASTASQFPASYRRLLVSNRYLVLKKLLGRRFVTRMPLVVSRDLLELARAAVRMDGTGVTGVCGGWLRARRLLRGLGREDNEEDLSLGLAELERFRVRRAAAWPWTGERR